MIRRPRILGFRGSCAIRIGEGEPTPLASLGGNVAPAAGLGGPRVPAVSGSVGSGA